MDHAREGEMRNMRMRFGRTATVAAVWIGAAALSLAQSVPATNATSLLKVGIATVDITPSESVWMQGFAARKAPSTGVFKNLSATCMVFDNGETCLGLMALDLCKISTQELDAIRVAAQKVGIPPHQMMINCSHTHCGPTMSSKNAAYVTQFTARTCGLLAAATADLKDAKLDYALGSSTMGVNRRQLDSQGKAIGMRPEPRKPIDPDVPVLRVLGSTNHVRAVVFGYACHPTTLQANCMDIAPDYVGFARDWIAAAYTNCTPVFLQGFGGDVKPRYVSPTGRFGYVLLDMKQTVAEIGHELGRAVLTAVCVPPEPVAAVSGKPMPLAGVSKKVSLPDKKDSKPPHEIEVAAIRIGNVYVVFSQCEVCVEVGLRIKRELADWCRQTQSHVWTCAYSHWGGGYLPAAASYPEGGYEVTTSTLSPTSEDIHVRETVALVKSLKRIDSQ